MYAMLLISICERAEARCGGQGVVQEKPFRLGDSIANEILLSSAVSSEHASGAVLDIEAEIKLAFDHRTKSDDSASCTQEMKDLGLKRYSPQTTVCLCIELSTS